ncbi:MAG: phosphomannomutase [Pseudonocardiales bacterium]|nr:MAG: phosphomannomutase [Pseudonocardiales bacterium]
MPAADLPARVTAWIAADPDPVTRAELQALLDAGSPDSTADLAQRFAAPLVFGTAGLRGPLRAGPNGMNRAVVRRAAAGLGAFLDAAGRPGAVVIGYDARFGSADFARDTAGVLQATGRPAVVLPGPLPTPVLAFAVRHLQAVAGVMVTASHNPPGDNGYKVYLGDGGQIVPPADRDIEAAIAAVGPASSIALDEGYQVLGDEVVDAYVSGVVRLLSPAADRDLTIAYTPLHGVGAAVARAVFARAGFPPLHVVAEQERPDPRFPTVAFPNPEEPGATDLLRALATTTGADLAIANDPDADRCAVISGGRMLTGDELGVLLADHLMTRGVRPGAAFATTIVSSSLLGAMCARHGVPYAETLTGFKWIARAGDLKPETRFLFGYEEALGYTVGTTVRDKDGIGAALAVLSLATRARAGGDSLLEAYDALEAAHGVHLTGQITVPTTEPVHVMSRLRIAAPAELAGQVVTSTSDLTGGTGDLPSADVLRYWLAGARVVIRPSGTEPRIKAYLEVVEPVIAGRLTEARRAARARMDPLREAVRELLNG